MKDQYFGDVNDYLKYGLLRAWLGATAPRAAPAFRLGVCWMLTPGDGRADGGRIGYLDEPGWRDHDPALFDHLRSCVRAGRRAVSSIQTGSWLPGARFFRDAPPGARPRREAWLDRMDAALAGCDLVFFDPDNGLEVASASTARRVSPKHARWSELARAWERGASLLVFQHFPREERRAYLARRLAGLAPRCPGARTDAFVTTRVAYLLAAQPRHAAALARAARGVGERWAPRIEVPAALAPAR
jgi:hypothetical protein